MTESILTYRLAKPEDARDIALLFDLANAGQIEDVWRHEAPPDGTWIDVAVSHMSNPLSEISLGRTIVADLDGRVVGMVICVQQPNPLPELNVEEEPDHSRSFAELRQMVPGSFFIRDIAVFPDYQGYGLAKGMLDLAIKVAYDMGYSLISIVTHETNERMLRHCQNRGMRVIARRPALAHPTFPASTDWLLLTCEKPAGFVPEQNEESASHGQ